jgi:hypothetical protein
MNIDFPLDEWKTTICLQDWDIKLNYVNNLGKEHWGVVRWQSQDRFAIINIADNIPEDMRNYTTVHELVHLAWFELQDMLEHIGHLLTDSREMNIVRSLQKKSVEVGVNRMTKALLELNGQPYTPIGLDCETVQEAAYSGMLLSSPLYPSQNGVHPDGAEVVN